MTNESSEPPENVQWFLMLDVLLFEMNDLFSVSNDHFLKIYCYLCRMIAKINEPLITHQKVEFSRKKSHTI